MLKRFFKYKFGYEFWNCVIFHIRIGIYIIFCTLTIKMNQEREVKEQSSYKILHFFLLDFVEIYR